MQDYTKVIYLYLDFRQQGLSLAPMDLDIISEWKKLGLNPNLISQVMFEVAMECKKKGRGFPTNLLSIHKKAIRVLKKSQEY